MCTMNTLFILAILAMLVVGNSSLYLETFHTDVFKVPEDVVHTLNVSLRFNSSEETNYYSGGSLSPGAALLVVTAFPDEDWKLDFQNNSAVFTAEEVSRGVNKSIRFSGYYWGFTQVSFYLTRNDLDHGFKNWTLLRDDLEIVVDRGSLVVDTIFISVGSVLVLLNTINMGAQLDTKMIVSVLKRPLGPLCGFLSQFIFMPVATWTMGRLLFDDPLYKLGLFTYGCSPGGTGSNFWTLMFNGDINLSITMTTISTIAAMGMMPLWMFTLGTTLLEENGSLRIPFTNLAISLITLTVPISIGILIRMKKPTWADKGEKVLKPFSFFILIFFMAVGTYNSYKVVLMMTWQMLAAGFMVMLLGYSLGALLAKIMCLPGNQIIAVSIETALQNPGVAFILLKLSLESPYSDLASVPVIATLFLTGPPLIFVFLVYLMARRFCGCCPNAGNEMKEATPMTEVPETSKFLADAEEK